MKRFIRAIVAGLVLLASGVAVAGLPSAEFVITATGGYRIASVKSAGVSLIEALADGNAQIYFIDSTDGVGAAANGRNQIWPEAVFGVGYCSLRASSPRPFSAYATGADSVYVTLGTAAEVILTVTY